MTYKDGFNKFPVFDDDKPNDHIDQSKENNHLLVPGYKSHKNKQ